MMRQYAGLWFPDDGTLTKALKVRLDEQETYRGDRLTEALAQVKDFSTAVECGAHVGSWTVILAKRFERVIAIEPEPMNFECLLANTQHLANVERVNGAVGDHTGTTYLISRKTRMGAQVSQYGTPVPIGTLDGSGIKRCGYLKVHVNGYEFAALRGAVETIRRCRPVMTVVFKPKLIDYGTNPDEMHAWILAQGYREAPAQAPYRVFIPQ